MHRLRSFVASLDQLDPLGLAIAVLVGILIGTTATYAVFLFEL